MVKFLARTSAWMTAQVSCGLHAQAHVLAILACACMCRASPLNKAATHTSLQCSSLRTTLAAASQWYAFAPAGAAMHVTLN